MAADRLKTFVRLAHDVLHTARTAFSNASPRKCRVDNFGTIDGPVYVIGDVHGCADLLAAVINGIKSDAEALNCKPTIILLGDLVDYGPASGATVDLILATKAEIPIHSVLGNHDRMFLDFLQRPEATSYWLATWGERTLGSYGVNIPALRNAADRSGAEAKSLIARHIPEAHVSWLSSLPHLISFTIDSQPYLLSHAGFDLRRPLDAQVEETVLWGACCDFTGSKWFHVLGHVINDFPDPISSPVFLDTGAPTTGRLSSLKICKTTQQSLLVNGLDPLGANQ